MWDKPLGKQHTRNVFVSLSYYSFLFLVARFGNTFLLLSRTTNVGHHASKEAGTACIYLFSCCFLLRSCGYFWEKCGLCVLGIFGVGISAL